MQRDADGNDLLDREHNICLVSHILDRVVRKAGGLSKRSYSHIPDIHQLYGVIVEALLKLRLLPHLHFHLLSQLQAGVRGDGFPVRPDVPDLLPV